MFIVVLEDMEDLYTRIGATISNSKRVTESGKLPLFCESFSLNIFLFKYSIFCEIYTGVLIVIVNNKKKVSRKYLLAVLCCSKMQDRPSYR